MTMITDEHENWWVHHGTVGWVWPFVERLCWPDDWWLYSCKLCFCHLLPIYIYIHIHMHVCYFKIYSIYIYIVLVWSAKDSISLTIQYPSTINSRCWIASGHVVYNHQAPARDCCTRSQWQAQLQTFSQSSTPWPKFNNSSHGFVQK